MTKLNELENLTWYELKEAGFLYYDKIFTFLIKDTLDYVNTTWKELEVISAIKNNEKSTLVLSHKLDTNFKKWIDRNIENLSEKTDLDKVVELMTIWITDELIWRYYEKPVLIGMTCNSKKELIETFLKSNCSLNVERRESMLETIDFVDCYRLFKHCIDDTDVKLHQVGFNYYGLETINNNELEIDQLI